MSKIDLLNSSIDATLYNEKMTDLALDYVYCKYEQMPRTRFIKKELDLAILNGDIEKIEIFSTAYRWTKKISMNEYLDLWCYGLGLEREANKCRKDCI